MAFGRSLLRSLAVAARTTTTTTSKSKPSLAATMSTTASSSSPKRSRNRPYTIVVEGNIGSGKTTFLDKFDKDQVMVLSEPVDRWRDVQGHNLLDLMYSDPARWSLLFQTYVQLTMVQQHAVTTDKPVKIMERSLARYCFIENLYNQGKMSDCEYAVISEWFNYLVSCPDMDFSCDLIVYLRTSPEVAHRRVVRRSRQEESPVSLEYLTQLHELHEDWLVRRTKFQPLPAPVMVIDADRDLEGTLTHYRASREEILRMARESG